MPQKQSHLVAYSALMCALIMVSTLWLKFPIPGTSILFTTQVFFVLLCGQLLPPKYCFYAIGTYLVLGLMGIPVFSATQGIAVVATPSFGYLLSFPFAAAAVSLVRRLGKGRKSTYFIGSAVGIVVIYAIALPYIALLNAFYLENPVPTQALFSAYCFAFLPMDLVKGAMAALVAPRLQRALRLP